MRDFTDYNTYNLYVLRAHYQVRAKQKMLGSDWYVEKNKKNLTLYEKRDCPDPEKPEIKDVEKYNISLNMIIPNLQDLYKQIQSVCSEFKNRTSFHLYWKNSTSTVQPISNYISYLSMVSLRARSNNNLYLIAREWNKDWINNVASTYVAIPEDVVLVNMITPRQSVFTRAQENHMNIVKAAARAEFTRTYNPPAKEAEMKKKIKEKTKEGKEAKSPKSPKSKATKGK